MQQQIRERQSRRSQGLPAENAGLGAAADQAALAAAGDDTEEDGKQDEPPAPPAPLSDVEDNDPSVKDPSFPLWKKPSRDPQLVRDHTETIISKVRRSQYYKKLISWMDSHHGR